MAFNEAEAKSIKIAAEVLLSDAECEKQGIPLGSTHTVTWIEHAHALTHEIEWSPGTDRGWLRWGPKGQLPSIP